MAVCHFLGAEPTFEAETAEAGTVAGADAGVVANTGAAGATLTAPGINAAPVNGTAEAAAGVLVVEPAGASSTLPDAARARSFETYARASVQQKNTAAQTAVDRDRKFALPVAPNRLPEAPLPKDAPMSAPLPC